ncbi:TonB-dependent receptor [Sphingomonas sp.]|uniref:TonB-dependent receptor plug domain-containing protein n=1 Tax=Sphingomonas sp. TaxID=28214 RepID=UPI0018137229|nr:TonB-dependent receptor [Sphingomonas sp.]MBA3511787.1 TonB-dependent receptor [Sphingomonas sp.]
MSKHAIRSLMLATLSPLALASPAAAQQNQEAVQDAPEAQRQGELPDQSTIVVTGTRRTDRTVADSPVPVDVISAESLSQSGHTEINRALTQEVPSFNFPQPAITDGTDVIRPATLRGLSPDQTLVLINGKRRHTSALLNINGSVGRGSAAVDINLIPTIALSRVEVLRDGAAAQYGSDAIAGVINFQLRSARSGGRASVTYGQYFTRVNDIQTYDSVVVGPGNTPVFSPDGTLQLDYTGEDRRRRDGETLTLAGVVGLPVGSAGHVNIAAEFQDRNDTNRTGADPRRQYPLIGSALDPRELEFNRFSHRYGDPETRDTKIFANAEMPFGGEGGTEAYAFASYNDRQGESAGFYRRALDARNNRAIYPNGFLPLITTDTDDYSGTVGVRGDMSGWRWDLSGQYGRDRVDFRIVNSLNRSLGPDSPTEFDSGGLKYGQTLFNLDVSRDLVLGFAEKTTLSLGAEYRREAFDIRPGEPNSYISGSFGGAPGAQVFPGFTPTIAGQQVDRERKRNNKSLYAEIDSDISSMFNVQAALRYENYSDFGTDLNWKLASRVEPVRGFALRASASTGFRAPSLQQQFYAAQATNNVVGVGLLDTVTLPVDNPAALALGSSPLDAEQSMSFSGGLVVSAVPRLNVTVDAYQVDIDDRILVTENLGAFGTSAQRAAVLAILSAAGFPSVAAARFFVNGVDTRTRGLDLVATYRVAMADMGRLNLTGGFNLNKTKITRNAAVPGALATIPGLALFSRLESRRLTHGQPRNKINASADYDHHWFGATLRATRYGKVLAAGNDEFTDVNLKPKTITDLELRVKPMGDRFTLALGGNNIFDVYPTNTPRGRAVDPATGLERNYPDTNYALPFSQFSPFGFNGRFLYGRLSANF